MNMLYCRSSIKGTSTKKKAPEIHTIFFLAIFHEITQKAHDMIEKKKKFLKTSHEKDTRKLGLNTHMPQPFIFITEIQLIM